MIEMTCLKFREEKRGGHVHVTVFVGADADHLQHAGELVFREVEWLTVCNAIECVRILYSLGLRVIR